MTVQAPVPAGKQVAEVAAYLPEVGESTLQYKMKAGVCSFLIPQVQIYAVCRIALR